MEDSGHFSVLPPEECRQLLADQSVGRVCWRAADGLTVLPVVYGLDGERIVFRTSRGTKLAHLGEPTEVAFQVDDLDAATKVGWTVLVRGIAESYTGDADPQTPAAWVPGDRRMLVQIRPVTYSGRAVSAAEGGQA